MPSKGILLSGENLEICQIMKRACETFPVVFQSSCEGACEEYSVLYCGAEEGDAVSLHTHDEHVQVFLWLHTIVKVINTVAAEAAIQTALDDNGPAQRLESMVLTIMGILALKKISQ